MIAKLLALFQNRPTTRKEELVVEALRRETRSEHNGSTVDTSDDGKVREIMSSIAANPAEAPSPQSPAASYLIPVFGSLAAIALVLFLFISLSEKDKLISPIREQTKLIETLEIGTYPINHSVEPLPEESLNALRQVAYTFPFTVEATRLQRDIRRGTDSFLAIFLPWGDLVNSTPTITVPVFPPFPKTPYQAEFDNLRRDTDQAIDFIQETLSAFNG
jgi:hypothetical protein